MRGVATVSKDNKVRKDDIGTGGSSEGTGNAGTPRALPGDPREGRRGLAHPWGRMSRVSTVTRIPNRRHSFCASLFTLLTLCSRLLTIKGVQVHCRKLGL